MSQPPRNRPPVRRPGEGQPGRPSGQQAGRPVSRPRSVQAPPRRSDPFPIIMGGIIGALVVGLMVVVFLITQNSGSGNTTNTSGGNQQSAANTPITSDSNSQAAATADPNAAPRMSLADFKKLYDNTANRPLILDVRAKDAFDAGHIRGSISFPEADVDTRIKELPKDKLIVAYCQ